MHIAIDTSDPLTDNDKAMLRALIGEPANVTGVPETKPAAKAEPAKKATPAKKTAAAKPDPEPVEDPEEEPEPMAEEPLEDEEEPDEEADADDVSDEDLLAMAVKKATEMVAGGDAAKVREALDAAGASRVRELNKDNVRDFFKALP